MSKARLGAGSKLQVGDGASPENWTTLAELLTLERTGKEMPTVQVTNLSSPTVTTSSGGVVMYEEFLSGVAKAGIAKFTANYIPSDTTQTKFQNFFDGLPHHWRIICPNDPSTSPLISFGYWQFSGFVTLGGDIKFDPLKQMDLAGTITITGPDLFTTGAAPATGYTGS